MPNSDWERWERDFRRAAKADNLALFRDHLSTLGLPDEPEALLHGTILVVRACCAYSLLDGQSIAGFLQLQQYFPDDAPDAKYAFTFDLFGKAFGRVLVSSKVETIDLADLYEHPWWEYEISGYRCFWVSRTDGEYPSAEDLTHIETEVTEDLRFDYTENELGFWFHHCVNEGALLVTLQVQGVYDPDEDEEEAIQDL